MIRCFGSASKIAIAQRQGCEDAGRICWYTPDQPWEGLKEGMELCRTSFVLLVEAGLTRGAAGAKKR